VCVTQCVCHTVCVSHSVMYRILNCLLGLDRFRPYVIIIIYVEISTTKSETV